MARNYRIIEGAMYETVADETVIYAPGGNLYILNESAGLILRSVLNQGSPCEVTKLSWPSLMLMSKLLLQTSTSSCLSWFRVALSKSANELGPCFTTNAPLHVDQFISCSRISP